MHTYHVDHWRTRIEQIGGMHIAVGISRIKTLRRTGLELQPGPTEHKDTDPVYQPRIAPTTRKRDKVDDSQYQCSQCLLKGQIKGSHHCPACGTFDRLNLCNRLPCYNFDDAMAVTEGVWRSEDIPHHEASNTLRERALRRKTEVQCQDPEQQKQSTDLEGDRTSQSSNGYVPSDTIDNHSSIDTSWRQNRHAAAAAVPRAASAAASSSDVESDAKGLTRQETSHTDPDQCLATPIQANVGRGRGSGGHQAQNSNHKEGANLSKLSQTVNDKKHQEANTIMTTGSAGDNQTDNTQIIDVDEPIQPSNKRKGKKRNKKQHRNDKNNAGGEVAIYLTIDTDDDCEQRRGPDATHVNKHKSSGSKCNNEDMHKHPRTMNCTADEHSTQELVYECSDEKQVSIEAGRSQTIRITRSHGGGTLIYQLAEVVRERRSTIVDDERTAHAHTKMHLHDNAHLHVSKLPTSNILTTTHNNGSDGGVGNAAAGLLPADGRCHDPARESLSPDSPNELRHNKKEPENLRTGQPPNSKTNDYNVKGLEEKCCEVMSDLCDTSPSPRWRAGAVDVVPADSDLPSLSLLFRGISGQAEFLNGWGRFRGRPGIVMRGSGSNEWPDNNRQMFETPPQPNWTADSTPDLTSCISSNHCNSSGPVNDCIVSGGSSTLAQKRICDNPRPFATMHEACTAPHDHDPQKQGKRAGENNKSRPSTIPEPEDESIDPDCDYDDRDFGTTLGTYNNNNKQTLMQEPDLVNDTARIAERATTNTSMHLCRRWTCRTRTIWRTGCDRRGASST